MIEIKNLNYIYQPGMPNEKQALYDINITIEDHDFCAIIGHTGSGKSTLTQHLNALVKPTSGRIVIDGVDVTDPAADLRAVRRTVGLVFQYPEHQLFEETVYKDIAFGPVNMGLSEDVVKQRVFDAAELVGLDPALMDKSPFELSGGQKRRVAIAGVLSMQPRVLVLDEPTAGLDPHGRDEILSQLVSLYERSDMTILFVSHSMEDVAKIAKHIIVLNKGRIYTQGTVSQVFSQGVDLQKIGLNVPQVTLLTHKLISAGVDLPPDLYTVKYAAKIIAAKIQEKNNA